MGIEHQGLEASLPIFAEVERRSFRPVSSLAVRYNADTSMLRGKNIFAMYSGAHRCFTFGEVFTPRSLGPSPVFFFFLFLPHFVSYVLCCACGLVHGVLGKGLYVRVLMKRSRHTLFWMAGASLRRPVVRFYGLIKSAIRAQRLRLQHDPHGPHP